MVWERNNFTSYGELKFLATCHFLELSTSGKVHRSRKKCMQTRSVCGFLSGLALMKTTVLESMRTLSYFRLDTLPRGVTGTSCYCFEYNLHLIKIPSHLNRESIYIANWRDLGAPYRCYNLSKSSLREGINNGI